jgi:CDP-diacylglycerol--glycerol-3-phosphate 3-phosphatidyltransferase
LRRSETESSGSPDSIPLPRELLKDESMATVTPPPSKQPPVVNLPNILTTARFFLALVLFILIEHHQWVIGLVIFALAAVTDWLDGYLARKLNLGSTLGRNLDPLVDKVLMCGAFIFLMPVPGAGLTAWMVTVVVSRELIITGLRSFLENQGASFGADFLGKIKMVLQCGALIAIFIALQWPTRELAVTKDVFIYAMLAATALSGLQYLVKAFLLLRTEQP